MTSSNDSVVVTETIGLKNLTLYLKEIGLAESSDVFGMLMRLEFEDFEGHMSGKVMCDLYLEMDTIYEAISSFATFDIFFMVSRDEFGYEAAGVTEYIRSMKKVWRRQSELTDQLYTYNYEENTFDGVSDFSAEVHLVDQLVPSGALLNIEVYPYPTVVHYISFDRYNYFDWLADVGGFYTLAIATFFFLSTRIIKFANGKDVF